MKTDVNVQRKPAPAQPALKIKVSRANRDKLAKLPCAIFFF